MTLLFFIGTEAELIKVFPLMIKAKERNIDYRIISSGQNDISKSRVLKAVNGGRIDLKLSDESDITKTSLGLLKWYISTRKKADKLIREQLLSPKDIIAKDISGKGISNKDISDGNTVIIVHGDTISTVMGAYAGRRLGIPVAHVEAGLRSHNWCNPFPEEIDRMLVSRVASYHFAPGDEAVANLRGKSGVVNTDVNTLYDSYRFALQQECMDETVKKLIGEDYFVLVVHRQENVSNTALMSEIMEKATQITERHHKCVLVLHKITEIKLREMGLMDKINSDSNFVTVPRVDYFDFMKLLKGAQFVITDGGSNQEELSYMGKPALILRKNTERNEGIGENALMYGGDAEEIVRFADNYEDFKRDEIDGQWDVSDVILEAFEKLS